MKTIIFVESNTTGTGKLFIESALKKHFSVIFFTATPQKYTFLHDFINNELFEVVEVDTSDINAVIQKSSHCKNVVAVYSTSELFVEIAASLAEVHHLFTPSSQSVALCRDKINLGKILSEHQIGYPLTLAINQWSEAAERLSPPFVIKPRKGTGSMGVELVESTDKLKCKVQKIANSQEGDYLIQQYIDGTEYSAEIIGTNTGFSVLALIKKHVGTPPYFVETGHDCPASISIEQETHIIQQLTKALRAVGLLKGPSHIEFKINSNNQLFIIEINPRLAGGMIPVALNYVYKTDLVDLMLRLYCQELVKIPSQKFCTTSIRFLLAKGNGTLYKVNGIMEVKELDTIIEAGLMTQLGTEICISGSFKDRLAYVIASGNDTTQSTANAEAAVAKLSYQFR